MELFEALVPVPGAGDNCLVWHRPGVTRGSGDTDDEGAPLSWLMDNMDMLISNITPRTNGQR